MGMFVFHNTLEGYLHMFLLLAVNCSLFCVARDKKQKATEEQLDYAKD